MSATTSAAAGPDPESETDLDEGEIHDILRNDRRRLAIKCLQETDDGTLPVRELSERVAAIETDEDPPPRNKRQSVYVSLHQTHLPRLDDNGIVRYDEENKEVSLGDRVSEVAVYMEVVPRYGLSWGEYYFGLGLLATLTTVAVSIGVPAISQLTITLVAAGFYAVLMLSAAYHVYSQQDRLLFQRLRR
ncbi:MAG: hypothetical protein ABEI11_04125 [Haloarculaceae archaeon]